MILHFKQAKIRTQTYEVLLHRNKMCVICLNSDLVW